MAVATSAVLAVGPWVIAGLALVLIYKVVVVILVRSSKTDLYYHDRWTGLLIQRGNPDPPPRPRVRTGFGRRRDGPHLARIEGHRPGPRRSPRPGRTPSDAHNSQPLDHVQQDSGEANHLADTQVPHP
jgi:hypothetical protein